MTDDERIEEAEPEEVDPAWPDDDRKYSGLLEDNEA